MKNKLLNRIDELSQRLEAYIKQREEYNSALRRLDLAIKIDSQLIIELKNLLDEISAEDQQDQSE